MNRTVLFLGIIISLLPAVSSCEAMATPTKKTMPQGKSEPNQVSITSKSKTGESQIQQVTRVQQAQPEPNVTQSATAEPNLPALKMAEPNIATGSKIEPPAQKAAQVAATEPNKPPESKTADELCEKCTTLLGKYVDKDGFVNYRMLLRKKLELLNVLDSFKTLARSDYNAWSRNDKIAFWINAYNLELIKIILDNYPIESNRFLRLLWPPNSIRHIKGIWDEHKFIIMDEEFNLKSIEDRYFRDEFDEPRAFLAISYASVSGPPLRNEAYCGKDLDVRLDEQVKKFLAKPQAFGINRENARVSISSILSPSWQSSKFITKYGTDLKFKNQEPAVRAVLNFLTRYIPQPDVDYLETANYTIDYMNYDWSLNDRPGQQVGKI